MSKLKAEDQWKQDDDKLATHITSKITAADGTLIPGGTFSG